MRPLDPDNVPVRVINGMPQIGIIGSVFALTLTTDRIGTKEDGSPKAEMIVAARLRFDVEMARMIRDALDAQIKMLTQPPNERAN